jgi:hypothetical protein
VHEDLPRRLRGLPDSTFVHQLGSDEFEALLAGAGPDLPSLSYLIQYTLDGSIRDTLAQFPGPSLFTRAASTGGRYPETTELLFAGRPVWAAGDGWIAVGHGDSSRVTILSPNGIRRLVISWPDYRESLRHEDRYALADWYFRQVFPNYDASSAETWRGMTTKEREARKRNLAARLPFAETRPSLAALFGSGRCLWLAGFSPKDNGFGVSLTLFGFHIDDAAYIGTVVIPIRGSRIRDLSAQAVYTTQLDEHGSQVVRRYRLADQRRW